MYCNCITTKKQVLPGSAIVLSNKTNQILMQYNGV